MKPLFAFGRTCLLALGLGCLSAPAAAAPFVFQLEGGTVNKKDTYQNPTWDTVNLKYSYEKPVILAIPNTNGGHPADFRIRNIGSTSFEVTLAEPPSEDGPHIAMDVAYVAVESGFWQLPDKTQVAAGFVTTNQAVFKNGGGYVTVSLPSGFKNPVVFAQLQGQNNEQNNLPSQPSSPWITVAVRNITANSFQVALDGCECTTGNLPVNETIGWFAIESGITSGFVDSDMKSIVYETINTGNVITGWDNGGSVVGFSQNYTSTPLFVAKLQTRNEGDGGWPRYFNLNTNGVQLVVDEDECSDAERFHIGESAGLFVFSDNFRVQDDDPDKDGIASGLDNCPLIANPGQEDLDQDGQGNACDCGDGLVVSGESCDDGNTSNADGCNQACVVETGWQCNGSPSSCTPICGDGLIRGSEACDDSNLNNGDGCNNTCQVETGFSCMGEPSVCAAICGDGLIRGGENCDDNNSNSNDGCSATCSIELGWYCQGEPSVCTTQCGDGFIAGAEACDDNNANSGDGCSASCGVESGYQCTGQPSNCTTICGDGLIVGAEGCDDQNQASGDGCSDICQIEPGWLCNGSPSSCISICGDGLIVGAEGCDDNNIAVGDGCSALCQVEAGYSCNGQPSVCQSVCGDGLIVAMEGCDDANLMMGDGCGIDCQVEAGWTCMGIPSACQTICGDGLIRGAEACDDMNVVVGDGCSDMCSIEPGYSCTGEPSVCTPGCGDGILAGSEECDDGNTEDGDGCSSTCENEPPPGTGGAGGEGGAGGSGGLGGAGGAGGKASGQGGAASEDDELYDLNGRGCACRYPAAPGSGPWSLMGLLLLVMRHRRRRR